MKIIAIGTVVLAAAAAGAAQTEKQTVLFVCEHGAAKSVVAAAHFNQLAAERGLSFRAISRGTTPDASVSAPIIDGLRNEGLNVPPRFSPSAATAVDVEEATYIIAFDVTLPISGQDSRVIRWDHLPAFSDGYPKASAAIRAKVRSLVQELESSAMTDIIRRCVPRRMVTLTIGRP